MSTKFPPSSFIVICIPEGELLKQKQENKKKGWEREKDPKNVKFFSNFHSALLEVTDNGLVIKP